MTKHACLVMLNEYASERNCQLSSGVLQAPLDSSAPPRQCLRAFSGSPGTCHNASILTDEEVSNTLSAMVAPANSI